MHKKDNQNFHDLINQYITERGFLQNFIARKLNLSNTFLSRWKTDRFPNFDTLLSFCDLLQLKKNEKQHLIKQYIRARAHKEAKKAIFYLEKK